MLTDDYIAGFFDGDGCIRYNTHNDKRGFSYVELVVHITSTDKTVLDSIQNHLKCGKIYETGNHKNGWKHCYRLSFTKKADMLIVLNKLYPYSIIKKEEFEKAIKFLESK